MLHVEHPAAPNRAKFVTIMATFLRFLPFFPVDFFIMDVYRDVAPAIRAGVFHFGLDMA